MICLVDDGSHSACIDVVPHLGAGPEQKVSAMPIVTTWL